MNKELIAVFEYLEREKGIKRQIVIDAIEESLCAAARKNISGASNVTVKINQKTGDISVFCEKEIVDEVEVAAVPGEAFGPSGYLRFSYALGDEDIVEGIGRIKKLLTEG